MWNCQPPIKTKLQKRYDSLLKDHERLGQAFRNQEKETQLLGQQLEEKEKEYEEVANDAEELANLVRTKCEAIKTLEKRLVEAKKLIASLKQELQSARNSSSVTEPQHPDPPQQQSTLVSSHSPTVVQLLADCRPTVGRQFFGGAVLHFFPFFAHQVSKSLLSKASRL